MTASQIINEIERLADDERNAVVDFVRNLPNCKTVDSMNEPVDTLPTFGSVDELFKDLED
jgi:hypothetical protein